MKNIIRISLDKFKKINIENLTKMSKDVVLYVDEFNYYVGNTYKVENGEYKFFDRPTHIEYMYNYGITCGCQRKIIDDRVHLQYNNKDITELQYKFMQNRALQLKYVGKLKGCGCVKKRPK